MSGFVAIFGRKATEKELRRMLSASPHRGEDFDLAIGRSSAAGIQTFENEDPFIAPAILRDNELLITFAGCLHREDSIIGAQDASRSFADLYRKGGPAALRNQSGSFSAVVIDENANRCIAIRTPPGERPLFYRRIGQVLAFASEPKQLTTDPFRKPKPDIEALIDLVSYRLRLLDRTPFDGVRRLMPGTQLTFPQIDEAHVERFWDPFSIVGSARISIDGAIDEFRRLLGLAVKRRLRAGTGVLLSGGLDSTSVAATAAPIHRERYELSLQVVSAAYSDYPEVDESGYIREFADALGVKTNWVYPKPRPFADLDFGAWLHDGVDIGPMSSNFSQILRAARASRIPSVLDGHDGDAPFGIGIGALHALLRRGQIGAAVRHLSFTRRRSSTGIASLIRRNLIPALVDFAPAVRVAYRRLKGTEDKVPSWATENLRQLLGDEALPNGWREAQAIVCERHLLLAMEQVERLGAIEGVAVLHPLCDPDLLTFLMGLPPEIRYHTGAPKSLVRSGLREIPASIRGRTDKTAFDAAAIGGAPTREVLEEARKSPQLLPGVDWKELESCLESRELVFPERSIVGRVLSADRFLGSQ